MSAVKVRTCTHCTGSGEYPIGYQCGHCRGAGRFSAPDPICVRALAHERALVDAARQLGPRCGVCSGPVSYSADAWADTWQCETPSCGHRERIPLGD